MLRTLVLTIAIAALSGSTAIAQTIRTPVPAEPAGALLVKHDKDDNGHGRKLGHFKQRNTDAENDDEDGGRRSSVRSRATARSLRNYGPSPYYGGPPGYGNSYPGPYYDYYEPPYYRGY